MAHDQDNERGEGRPRVRPDEAVRRPRVQARSTDSTASSPTSASTRARSTKGDIIVNTQQREAQGARAAHGPHALRRDARRSTSPRRATSSRSSASSATRATRSPTARSTSRMTSMHVPDAVISLAVAPKDRAARDQLLEGAQPLHEGRPDLPRAPGRGVAADHHQRHGRAPPRHLHRAHEARVQLRGRRRASRRSRTARRSRSAPSSTTRTRSRPAARASTARSCGYIEPLPADAVETYEFVDDIVGRLDPARVHPGVRQGLQGGRQEGHAHRLPGRRRPRARSTTARRHAVDSSEHGVQDGRAHGLPRGLREARKPTILEPIMKVEIEAPDEFQGAVVGQVNQRRGVILETVERRQRERHLPRCR